jgi:hypothetical protein
MRIPVLIMLPAQEPLRESASAFLAKRAPKIDFSYTQMPPGVNLDVNFSAIPVGTGSLFESPAASHPDVSENFAVRGFVEAEDASQIPESVGGHPLFADPKIESFQASPITCIGSPPMGSSASVRTNFRVTQLVQKGLDGSGIAIAIMDTGINLNHVQNKLGHAVLLDAANSWSPAGLSIPPGYRFLRATIQWIMDRCAHMTPC